MENIIDQKLEKNIQQIKHASRNFTSQISRSEYWPFGSRLVRIVPSKRVGSWGIIDSRVRKSFNPISLISTPSIKIRPPDASTNRKSARTNVLFPLPVRPTTPTLVPPSMIRVMPFKTSGVLGRYLSCNTVHHLTIFVRQDGDNAESYQHLHKSFY